MRALNYKILFRVAEIKVNTMFQIKIGLVKWLLLALMSYLSVGLQAASDDIEQEFDVSPGGTLILESDAGIIVVSPWDQDRVVVRVFNSSGFEVALSQQGNDVHVVADAENDFSIFRRSNIEFRVSVPNAYNLELNTGGGRIEVSDITGTIAADTSGGSIQIGNVIQGSVRADTSGGSITILNVDGDVIADTSGGAINIGNVAGDVTADTSGGRITIGNVQGNIVADTSGGNIEVGEGGGRVELNTSGGTIRAAWAQGPISADTSGGNIYLAGSSISVNADTSGGNIVIEGSGGPVIADTSGGSIMVRGGSGPVRASSSGGRIEVDLGNVSGSIGGSVDLETAGGDVTVHIPESLAATIDADVSLSRRFRGDYRIYTDFPLTIQEEDGGIIGRGDINGGGDRISIRTSNSDIHIIRIGN